MNVAPVLCAACGAAVALTEEPEVRCHHCGAVVAVSELHRRALGAEREAAAARRQADALRGKLGALPAWPLRVLGTVFGGWLQFAAGFLFVFAAVGAATIGLFLLLGALLHENLALTQSNEVKDSIGLPLWFGLMLVLVGLGVYGQRRAVSLRRVQAALSARPPARPGGPSTCRSCGGPLSVPADAIDVRCLYCATDNLVALPAAWVQELQQSNQAVHQQLDQASAAFQAQTRALRLRLALYLGFTAAVLGSMYLAASSQNRDFRRTRQYSSSDWSAHAGQPRGLLRRTPLTAMAGWGDSTPLAFPPDCSASPVQLRLTGPDCDANGCTLWLFAALRKGEQAHLRVSGVPREGRLTAQGPRWSATPSTGPHEVYGEELASVALAPGRAATLAVPWSTWYRLQVTLPGATKGVVGLCFDVSPGP